MRSHPVVWILRACWLSLPFTLGDALGAALGERSGAVELVGGVLAWAIWAAVLVASLIAHPRALTVLRVLTPTAPAAAIAASTLWAPDDPSTAATTLAMVGLATALVATAAAWSGATADEYVDGASYGDERRFALRVPMAFMIGPIPVFWLTLVGGCVVGPLLLADRQWVAGAIVSLVGVGVAPMAIKAFDGLSRRWLVFVPAGITAIDHLALVDPVLLPARSISAIGPALTGTSAVDLTQQALGLVVEVSFTSPVEIVARTSKSEGELTLVPALLFSPSRPGAVIAEARRRNLAVAHAP